MTPRPRSPLAALATCMLTFVALGATPACSPAGRPEATTELVGAPEVDVDLENLSGTLPVGTILDTTDDVNLRKNASKTAGVIRVMPAGVKVTLMQSAPANGFYKVKHDGTIGWAFGPFLKAAGQASPNDSSVTAKRQQAISRAKSGMGFSYWWGHGRWRAEGPTAATRGVCQGSCPSCSHSGQYGADCSGFVAKVWQVPSGNIDISDDEHPLNTSSFDSDSAQWKTVSRANMVQSDAMVYNDAGKGHIVIYSQGDGWGSLYAYECKGCDAGCVAGYRTVGSAYHAIHRAGY